MKSKRKQERWVRFGRSVCIPLILGICAASLSALIVSRWDFLNAEEGEQESLRTFPPAKPNPKIEIISITADTIKRLAAPGRIHIPRTAYAELIDALKAAGAKVLLFDIWFQEAGPDDRRLTDALDRSAPLRIALLSDGPAVEDPTNLDGDWQRHRFPVPIIAPIPMPTNVQYGNGTSFEINGHQVGAIPFRHDMESGRVILHTTLIAVLQLLDIDPKLVELNRDGMLVAGPLEWHLEPNHQIYAHWTKNLEDFPELEFTQALEALKTKRGQERYKGKLVIVGNTADEDDKYEIGAFGRASGVRLITQLVNTTLERQSQRLLGLPMSQNLFLWFWLACVASWSILELRPLYGVLIVTLIALVSWKLPFWLAMRNVDIALLPPLLSVFISSTFALALRGLLGPSTETRPAGFEEECTILFADIRDSTGLTRRLGARTYRVVHTKLNKIASSLVSKHNGMIERTTGDGFMAVFRSSKSSAHALECLIAAKQLCNWLGKWNAKHSLAEKIELSMGAESGIVTGGYVREGGRRTWSSAGNAVNLAQRLQSSCTEFDSPIVIGPVAARLVEHEVPVTLIGQRIFKGFTTESGIYAVSADWLKLRGKGDPT